MYIKKVLFSLNQFIFYAISEYECKISVISEM